MFALVAAVVAAASAAGAPPRRLVTVGCDDAIKTAPPRSTMHTGGDNLTLGTLTLTRLARLADPVGFRRFRRGGLYRIPTYAVTTDEGAVTVAARGAAADATFAFGPKTRSGEGGHVRPVSQRRFLRQRQRLRRRRDRAEAGVLRVRDAARGRRLPADRAARGRTALRLNAVALGIDLDRRYGGMKVWPLAALLGAAAVAPATAAPAAAPPTRTCEQGITFEGSPYFGQQGSVVMGPLSFSGLATPGGQRQPDGGWLVKSVLLMRPGKAATLSVAEASRSRVTLVYQAGGRPSASVRFTPCADRNAAFSGGFLIRKLRCETIEVRVDGGPTYRRRIPFGGLLGPPCRR